MTKETVDEVISRIKFMCCDGCSSYRGVLCSACKLDDGMSVIECMENPNERVVTWHPYPQDKPKDGVTEYLISVAPEGGDPFVICSEWQNGYWGGFKNKDGSVTAWAEMPKPYKEVDG